MDNCLLTESRFRSIFSVHPASEDLRAAEHVRRERRSRAQGVPAQRCRCDRELHRAQALIRAYGVASAADSEPWAFNGSLVGRRPGSWRVQRSVIPRERCTIRSLSKFEARRGRAARWMEYRMSRVDRGVARCTCILYLADTPGCRNLFCATSSPLPVSHSIDDLRTHAKFDRCIVNRSRTEVKDTSLCLSRCAHGCGAIEQVEVPPNAVY